MQKLPTLQDWAWVETMLIQAMLGSISNNFRRISLSYKDSEWVLEVTLFEENEEDIEEVTEIVDMFGIYLSDIKDRISACSYAFIKGKIIINSNQLAFREQDSQHRFMFCKR